MKKYPGRPAIIKRVGAGGTRPYEGRGMYCWQHMNIRQTGG